MSDLNILAEGLRFPEGPIAMPDGSVILVEIARGTLTRVVDGETEVIVKLGGGPNGAAMGPDGYCYVCNNGGFQWNETADGRLFPGLEPENYSSGRIEVVDLATRRVDVLYTQCNGLPLRGPNDLVFDSNGGFWFTDHGKMRPREKDRTGVFYAKADGSYIEEKIFPLEGPNGIGLSPDETELYVAETHTGRLWAYRLDGPGRLQRGRGDRPEAGRLIPGRPGHFMFDSLAVDADGKVCIATIVDGGITVLDPNGGDPQHVPMPDVVTTNICFGGEDLRTAFITLSSTGKLVSMPWQSAGLPLNYLNK